jgi:hypothetical protein
VVDDALSVQAQVRQCVRLAPAAYGAGELPHCCERPCVRGALAAVEILALVAHYDVDVEMSCKSTGEEEIGQDNVHRISAMHKQVKFAKTENRLRSAARARSRLR